MGAHAEAAAALAHADEVAARVRRQGRWFALYAFAFGAATGGYVALLGLAPMDWGLKVGVFTPPVILLIAVLLPLWARRRPVAPARFGWWHTAMIAGWLVCYGVVIIVGGSLMIDVAAWWVAGAAITAAVPFLVGARTLWAAGGNAE
ncbi:hypothetical protein GCM10022205_49520 [Spinactinospora alkalitolerans]